MGILTGLASAGFAISDAAKDPKTPKPPSEMYKQDALQAKRRAAQAKGISSTIIAGRSPLGVPGGTAAA